MNNTTINYYNAHASAYTKDTYDLVFSANQNLFLSYLNPGSRILDFGCGSGRDAKYFLKKGFAVEASDGSEEMVRIASENTGIAVKQMLFTELDAVEEYDGIWACSSILHCSKDELKDVFCRMRNALKERGILYTSFKYGTFEGERSGRYFTYFTEQEFRDYLQQVSGLEIEKMWLSSDVRPGRNNEKWLNLIIRKVSKQTEI